MARTDPFKSIYNILNTYPPVAREFPVCVDVEFTNNCNLRCMMCPTGTGVMKMERGFMTNETFGKIIENLKAKQCGIFVKGWGEPLLHKEVIDYIKALKNDGHLVMLYTNAMLINEETAQSLVDSGLDKIKFSIQGVDTKTYKEMRVNGNFDKLVQNVTMIHKLRGEKERPYLYAGTTVTYESEEDVQKFKYQFGQICDAVGVGKTKLEHLNYERANIDETQKKYLREIQARKDTVTKRFRVCPEAVWAACAIRWDGNVSACNEDFDCDQMLLGNINNTPLRAIFNSPRLKEWRELLRSGDFSKLPRICGLCRDYMGLQ